METRQAPPCTSDAPVGRAYLPPREAMPRHRHRQAYAAIVLEGGYREAGDDGRFDLGPGDVVFHQEYRAHFNLVGARGCQLLDLPVWLSAGATRGKIDDPDTLVRLAERDVAEASAWLEEHVVAAKGALDDWPDRLAKALATGKAPRIDRWASKLGIGKDRLTRQFRTCYGVTPHRFRYETRAANAVAYLRWQHEGSLAETADLLGFCDQAHMSHAVKALTGKTPAQIASSRVTHSPNRRAF